ncbi:MAG: nitrite/sulfite reductase [Burkholderiaceae bacterium]|jgi:sulfite reductase (NADPH) hemoprotein beta-component
MYRYDDLDRGLVAERVQQYRGQLERYLNGALSEDEFRPLRLQNGLYIQRHAPMLRVAIPYGQLNTAQVRQLAHIARHFDRGYGHFSTRQNIQFNWPKLEQTADILECLASVEMHAIQTSGNCIRNTTSDHFAGIAADELADPRPTCELIRQWSTFHPEFAYLPRKFKIAVTGALVDRAAILAHDIGLQLTQDADGLAGYRVFAGGGLGRTPVIGHLIREFLPRCELLNYLDAMLRVYNLHGRRDNKYKARIKILVRDLTPAVYTAQVEAEWEHLRGGPAVLPDEEFARVEAFFEPPAYDVLPAESVVLHAQLADSMPFTSWFKRNVFPHKVPGYAAVTLSLKKTGVPPGDITDEQLDAVADLADRYSFGEVRVSHEQNLILADVRQDDLHAVWEKARALGLATPNIGLLTNIVCCPGGDFCSLANAKSIPVAQAIQERVEGRVDALDYLHDIGELDLNISGCINACGHHHIGHIGILGVDKNGEEWYQVTIGGAQGNEASLGKVIGPSFAREQMADVIERLLEVYVERRHPDELFIDTVRRLGVEPFREHVYRERAHA